MAIYFNLSSQESSLCLLPPYPYYRIVRALPEYAPTILSLSEMRHPWPLKLSPISFINSHYSNKKTRFLETIATITIRNFQYREFV